MVPVSLAPYGRRCAVPTTREVLGESDGSSGGVRAQGVLTFNHGTEPSASGPTVVSAALRRDPGVTLGRGLALEGPHFPCDTYLSPKLHFLLPHTLNLTS